MCDCFHLAFPNWHAASSGTGPGRRLHGPEPATEDDSICEEPSQFTERERPRPQGSSPVEEYPETKKYSDSDKECEAEYDPHHKSGAGKKTKKSGLGSMFERRSTPKMSKLKEVHSPESGVIVKTANDGCAEGLIYGGGGKEGIFIKEVVPESPASKSLKLKEGDQILSATVYFDNMSYEDAIQILEHAQAYKVKLCLKRKPEITETEPAIESDVIPEEELYTPEMREQGKTKRRGEARISWPKFSSLGKGRKSRFTRSHSSSEADEQRKLELSPTTSDTESPIKNLDALKYKKKHKIKLSSLTKRGRISSSEEQDTDVPTTGKISGEIHPTHKSDMLSPECLESPSGETPEVYVTEDLKVMEDLQLEQNNQTVTEAQTVQHKVELISIDSTLKTADLTVALADQESPSGIKSPDGKKKKKERSELKMKILGKDKSHKKEAKAKSSPKRLKTLGASFELADHPETEKSDLIPSFESHTKPAGEDPALDAKVELDLSDVAFSQKYPQKSEAKRQKGKEIKQKQETKTVQTFKLPKIGLGDIATEEVKDYPYDRLAKSSDSRTQLPKREDIEIPGMEDTSMKMTAKGIKEPKADYLGHNGDFQAETVQLSIDVDSVKEAVSKLPGYKLPKVDISGMPIPEEITVIDANAQRISVKTPTKVVDTKTKHIANLAKFDMDSLTGQLTSEDLLTETKVDFKKPEKEHKTKQKQSNKEMKTEIYKREDILIPGKESSEEVSIIQVHEADTTDGTEGMKFEYESDKKSKKAKMTMPSFGISKPDIRIPDIGIDLPKHNISQQKGEAAKGEKTTFLQEIKMSKTETKKGKGQTGGVLCEVKIPEIDGIEYIDSVDGSPAKQDGSIRLTGFDVNLDAKPNADISLQEIRSEVRNAETEEHAVKLPQFGAPTPDISVNVPDGDMAINIDGAEIKTHEREGKGSKFKMPNLGISMPKVKGPKTDSSPLKKDVAVTPPVAKAEGQLPEAPETDVTLASVDVFVPEQNMEIEKHELEIKHPEAEGEFDKQGGKFKMPKFGIKMPKIKGPEFDLSLSKKDTDLKLSETKVEVKLPEASKTDITVGTTVLSIPEKKVEVEKPEVEIKPLETKGELDGQGSKFKMPKLGITMPKIKGPEFDLGSSKKNEDVKLPEAKGKVKPPDAEQKESSANVEIRAPELKVVEKEESPSKFKMPTFKLPRFGAAMPNTSAEVSNISKDFEIPETHLESTEGVAVDTPTPNTDIVDSSLDVQTTAAEVEGKGTKFKMPNLGFSKPKVKGSKIDVSLSKTDVGVTLPEGNAKVKLPKVDLGEVEVSPPDAKIPEAEVKEKLPEANKIAVEVKAAEYEADIDRQGGKFKMPKFGVKIPKVKGSEYDLGSSKADIDVQIPQAKADVKPPEVDFGKTHVSIPEAMTKVKKPELEMQALHTEGQLDGQGEKLKMPKFGIKIPKFKGPETDLSLSKKHVDVTAQTEIETKLPDAHKIDVSLGNTEVLISQKKAEDEIEEHESKFKLPKFGIIIPKVKGPEFHLGLSKKDVNITTPEAKTDTSLPDVKLKAPSSKVEIKAPETEVAAKDTKGPSSAFKMPDFSFSMPKIKGPDINLSIPKKEADITLPAAELEVTHPESSDIYIGLGEEVLIPEVKTSEVQIKPFQTDIDLERKEAKFKMPEFGITIPKVKGPDTDLSFSKKDVNVAVPGAKAEVELPGTPKIAVDMKSPECEAEIDGQGSKFKMPKFGITMPKAKGPEIDLNFSKKDVEVSLPEAKAEVKLPDVEIKEPSGNVEIKVPDIPAQVGHVEGSQSKFKLPTFKLPKFGAAVSVDASDMDKDIKAEGATLKMPKDGADIAPQDTDIKGQSLNVKMTGTEGEGKETKFKIPKFGISLPKVVGPEIDLNLSKEEDKVDVKLQEVSEPDINLGKIDISIPEVKIEIKQPHQESKPLKSEGEPDGQGSKFKMPKLGILLPQAKGPETDIRLSKTDVDLTLPEAKAEVSLHGADIKISTSEVEIKEAQSSSAKGSPSKFKLPTFKFPKFGVTIPNVTAEVPDGEKEIKTGGADMQIFVPHRHGDIPEVKAEVPEVKAEVRKGSPSKFKMPTFKLPKFGVGTPSATADIPDMDEGVKVEGADISIPEEVLEVNIEAPSIETKGPLVSLKTTGTDHEGKGSKFKLPSLGFSVSQAQGPDIDLSLSKKDVDVTLPKAKAEVKLPDAELKKPSAEVEIEAYEIKVVTNDTEGSPSKFKMPTFKLPKFRVRSTSTTPKVPDIDKGVKVEGAGITIPKEVLEVNIDAPSIELKEPSITLKTTETEHEGKGSNFKLPRLGFSVPQSKGTDIDLSLSKKDVDITLPEAKAEVKLPDAELKKPSVEVETETPEIKVVTKDTKGSPSKFKMPTFKLPKFGVGTPSATADVSDMDKGVKLEGADISIPKEIHEVNTAAPSIELKEPSISLKTTETEHEGKGSKFKLPSLGFSIPQAQGPDINLSLSKKDVDVTLPEAKAEVKLPHAELKKPSVEVEIEAPQTKVETKDTESSPSKFKMPTFKFPKFGVRSTSTTPEVPDIDKGVKLEGADISIPEEILEVNIAAPSIELKEPSISLKSIETEHEGKGSKYKLPRLGFSEPQSKGTDIDLSLSKKDADVTLPKAKAEVKVPDAELKKPSAEVEIEAPEIKIVTKDTKGSPSKFKMPTFNLPKIGVGTPSATADVPDIDKGVKIEGAHISIPEEILEVNIEVPSIELKEPSISLKTTETEHEGKGSKFKLPSLGFSVSQVQGPDIDLSLSKKDVDVTLPEAKVEVNLPDVELEKPSAEVEIEAPEIKVVTKDTKGSPSKFKMPTFKLPKFGVGIPSTTAEVPDMDKGVKLEGADISIPEEIHEVNTAAPSIVLKEPSISLKTTETEHEGKGSKFKLPSLGFSVSQAQGPDIDLSLSKKDVDVTLPEAKAEVKLPDAELKKPSAEVEIEAPQIKVVTKDTKGSPSKFKMPTFKLPKFGVGIPSATAEVPDMDKGVKVEGADISIPEEVHEVNTATPSIELKEPSISLKTTETEHEGKGSKFKLPSLGFSVPQAQGADIDLSLSKKDVDVTLPEAKAEVKLPDAELKKPSAEVEIEAPEIKVVTKDTKGSPSKFKMPTFKLPKFGVGIPSATAELPDMDKGVKLEGADSIPKEIYEVNSAAPSIELKEPSISLKTTETEHEGKGSKFKLPSLGFSVSQSQGPDIDLSLSKKDVDVTLPEAKAEVKLPDVELEQPSAEVEIEAPEIKVVTKDTKGSPSKFKMPTFKLPKFGVGTSSTTVDIPDMGKGAKIEGADISIPEDILEVNIDAPSIELKEPSISLKTTGTEHEGKGSKFKLPSLGFSVSQAQGPHIDLSLSKKDVDVTLPEAKAEVKLPDAELEQPSAEVEIEAPEDKVVTKDTKGSPSKFKMPTFKLPKFRVGTPSTTAEVPDTDTGIKLEGADISIPEEVLEVNIDAPSIELKEPSISLKTTETEHEGKGSKFKLPSLGFSVSQAQGPDIDLSLSKKDVDVTLPEAKAEVKLPDFELEKLSAEVEIEAPEIKVVTKDTKGSPSKFKMPTFKLPKFGVGTSSATADVYDNDKGVKLEGADISIPEEVLEVNIEAPSIETKEPSVLKTTGPEHEGKGSKFKLPSLGFSVPQSKGVDIDLNLSKKDVDVTLPEAKAEVKLPDAEFKDSSVKVETEAPGTDLQISNVKGSPSKFKMPTFKSPKFGEVSVKVPDRNKGINVDGAELKLQEAKAEMKLPDVGIKEPVSSISVSQAPITDTDLEAKLKKPRFSLPKFSFSKQSGKEPQVDVNLPNTDAILPEGDTEVKQPDIEFKPKGGETELDGQKGKFKIPKFGITMPKVKDLNISKKDVDVTVSEIKAEVPLPDVKVEQPSAKVEIKAPKAEVQEGNIEVSQSKLKMPTMTVPKFEAATSKVSMGVSDVDKEIKTDVEPSIDSEGLSVNVKTKGGELEVSGSKFKMLNLGISVPKVKGPEIDLSLSKKDGDVSLPEAKAEVKLPHAEGKEAEGAISVPEAPIIEAEAKSKRPSWTFPKFSFSRTGDKASGVDVNTETSKVEIISTKAEVSLPDAEIERPSMEEPPAAELDANLKKMKFSLPRFSFSKSSIKEPEVGAELSHGDVSVPEGEVKVNHPETEIQTSDKEAEPGSTFKLPMIGIVQTKAKGPETDLNASKNNIDTKLPETKEEVKISEAEVEESSSSMEIKASESEVKSKDVGGSPLKLKIPPLKMPRFGSASYDVTTKAPKAEKVVDTDGSKLKDDVSATDKGLSINIKTDDSKATISDSETPKTKTDGVGHGSPSKFKLPFFKMPKLSFSTTKPEEGHLPADTEYKDDQLEKEVEMKGDSKSPKMILTSFGEILKTIDVEFDVPKVEKVEENLEISQDFQDIDEPTGTQLEAKAKETNTMQDTSKSPERTGWFKFPKFGLSSPSEPPNASEKGEQKDEKSPVGGTGDEEISPTCSVQSSDAFGDISSTITSEHVGPSISSPTKVTVKYSDPNATELGETHSKIITSTTTTRTELISIEPNLPEKITILSSGVSSSSEDTLRLESGKIHVITTNIQATPEAQHAKLLTDIEVELAGGLPLKSEVNETASWTVEDSESGKRAVFESHLVKETSSERSESRETIVITKQITHVFDSSEPISGETASSIQRLRNSVHSEKMRFFDDAEK